MTRRALIALPLAAIAPAQSVVTDREWARVVAAALDCMPTPDDRESLVYAFINGLLDDFSAARNPSEKARVYANLNYLISGMKGDCRALTARRSFHNSAYVRTVTV